MTSVEAAGAASSRRVAALAYQRAVRDTFSPLGVVDPGRPPTIFVEMDAALDALAKGKTPADAERTLRRAAEDAAAAKEELEAFDVTATIRDQGFDPLASASFAGSAITLGSALDLYRQAARVATSAIAVSGPERARLADVAVDLRDTASGNLIAGWTRYLQALEAGGIPEPPTVGGAVPGLGRGMSGRAPGDGSGPDRRHREPRRRQGQGGAADRRGHLAPARAACRPRGTGCGQSGRDGVEVSRGGRARCSGSSP